MPGTNGQKCPRNPQTEPNKQMQCCGPHYQSRDHEESIIHVSYLLVKTEQIAEHWYGQDWCTVGMSHLAAEKLHVSELFPGRSDSTSKP